MRRGGACRWVSVGLVADHVARHLEGVGQGARRGEPHPPHRLGVAADHDHPAQVLEGVCAPVPHVEGVDPVVGVAGAVEVDVPRIGGVGLLVLLVHLDGIGGLGQHLIEEVDVARMVGGVELPPGRVAQDHHPALTHERPPSVEVEEVAEPEARHEDRVHDRVDVVGADVGERQVRMSAWPSISTPCWAHTLRVVISWTASTSPAWTEVMAWGARMEWRIWRTRRGGAPDIAAELAAKAARSRRSTPTPGAGGSRTARERRRC